jgi:hypothetical protein
MLLEYIQVEAIGGVEKCSQIITDNFEIKLLSSKAADWYGIIGVFIKL